MSATLLGRQFFQDTDADGGPTRTSLFIADAAVRQTHSQGGEVTQHPVEDGSSIADHVICEPNRLTIEAEVSQSPSCRINGEDSGFADGAAKLQGAYDRLLEIKRRKEIFNVQTKLHYYRDMVIESLDASQDADTCSVLRFQVNLVQVSIVGSETSVLQRTIAPAQESIQPPIYTGDIFGNGVSLCDVFVVSPDYLACCAVGDRVQRQACFNALNAGSGGVITRGDL